MIPLQCATCVHYVSESRCPAFPRGIPTEILTGKIDHDHVTKGQRGDFVWTEINAEGGKK